MARSSRKERVKSGEGIVGIRMSSELIADLKAEARQRKISLGKLMEELWADHRSSKTVQRR
jgi:hypothetical protein